MKKLALCLFIIVFVMASIPAFAAETQRTKVAACKTELKWDGDNLIQTWLSCPTYAWTTPEGLKALADDFSRSLECVIFVMTPDGTTLTNENTHVYYTNANNEVIEFPVGSDGIDFSHEIFERAKDGDKEWVAYGIPKTFCLNPLEGGLNIIGGEFLNQDVVIALAAHEELAALAPPGINVTTLSEALAQWFESEKIEEVVFNWLEDWRWEIRYDSDSNEDTNSETFQITTAPETPSIITAPDNSSIHRIEAIDGDFAIVYPEVELALYVYTDKSVGHVFYTTDTGFSIGDRSSCELEDLGDELRWKLNVYLEANSSTIGQHAYIMEACPWEDTESHYGDDHGTLEFEFSVDFLESPADITITKKKIEEENPIFVMSYQYPVFNVNGNDRLQAFLDSIQEDILSLRDMEYTTKTTSSSEGQNLISGSYNSTFYSDSLLHIYVNYTSEPYGANGLWERTKSYFLDLENTKVITLTDLFSTDEASVFATLNPLISEYLMSMDIANDFMTLTGSENFLFNTYSLTIEFNPYEIAAGAAGWITVTIPWSSINLPHSEVLLRLAI